MDKKGIIRAAIINKELEELSSLLKTAFYSAEDILINEEDFLALEKADIEKWNIVDPIFGEILSNRFCQIVYRCDELSLFAEKKGKEINKKIIDKALHYFEYKNSGFKGSYNNYLKNEKDAIMRKNKEKVSIYSFLDNLRPLIDEDLGEKNNQFRPVL